MNARIPASALHNIDDSLVKESTVFMSGNSQAVRLPKGFQINSDRVTLRRVGNDIVISPKIKTMQELLDILPIIPDAPLTHEDGPEEPVEAW